MSRSTVTVSRMDLPTPKPLSPREQLEAVRRAQSRVEQRVKLGVQLFRSAEAHLTEQQDLLTQAKQEQASLREQLETDLARSLRAYGQRTQHMDDRLTDAIDKLEHRLDVLQDRWQETEQRLEQMVRRSETLLHQSRSMLETGQARRPSVRT